jgi:hypothetical protein
MQENDVMTAILPYTPVWLNSPDNPTAAAKLTKKNVYSPNLVKLKLLESLLINRLGPGNVNIMDSRANKNNILVKVLNLFDFNDHK